MSEIGHPIGDPYQLMGSRIVFTNWHYIDPGSVGWYDSEGGSVRLISQQGPYDAIFRGNNCPFGIKLSVKNALRSGPLLNDEMEWEKGGVTITTVIKDGNMYKAWGNTGWGSSLTEREISYISYYMSEDGYNWNRPVCGIVNYKGNTNNNLLCGPLFYGTVFIDPTSDDERYKMVCEENFSMNEYQEYIENISKSNVIEPEVFFDKGIHGPDEGAYGVRGAVSPDGVHWKILMRPLAVTVADTQVVAYYDTVLKKYVLYSRSWRAGRQAEAFNTKGYSSRWSRIGRRSINRAESHDFHVFPNPETIIEPSLQMLPNEVLYTNCRTSVPGAPEQHLMFPVVWNASGGDKTHILMYTSSDGKIWNVASGRPVMETAAFGQWDGGCIFASPNLIELPNGDFALPYTGWDVPHKYARINAKRNTGYALWPKGRLMALETEELGEFTTVAIIPPGDRLFINAVTERAGYIIVEACDIHGIPLPGRDFENCIPLFGDRHKAPVVWKNSDRLGIEKNEAVVLRIRMNKGSIYSLDFC